ncbi:MAG TPA: insulinase family protein [Longimicrobium sp.]|jgi:zinc protease
MRVDLPSSTVRLDNGLLLVLHPDTALPGVGVELFIRGGSREEAAGNFGIAHLFEHNIPAPARFLSNTENRALHGRTLQGRGAGTEPDFLRFYMQSEAEGLEAALALLADRLESDSAQFTEATLQRDQNIVISELRRSMSIDWDTEVLARLHEGTFGSSHPYGHSVSGLEEDVRSATVPLMRAWHERYAGAANAVLVIAGNFDPAQGEAATRRYFAPIAPGVQLPRLGEWIPAPTPRRETIEKPIPRGIVYLTWPVPAWGTHDGGRLALFVRVLGRRLMQVAAADPALDSTFAKIDLREAAGMVTVGGVVAEGASPDSAEARVRTTLQEVLRQGVTAAELAAARSLMWTEFLQSLENIAFRESRTDVLGLGVLFKGNANHFQTQWARIESATPPEVVLAATQWLGRSSYVLQVRPAATLTARGTADRRATVARTRRSAAEVPVVREFTTRSGLRIAAVDRPRLPLVDVTVAFWAGTMTDDPVHSGRASAALAVVPLLPLKPGGATLRDSLSSLGGSLGTSIDRDFATLSVTLPAAAAIPGLALIAEALGRVPPDSVVEAARGYVAQRTAGQQSRPMQIREQVLACLVDGDPGCTQPAPSTPHTTAQSVKEFLARHYRPGNAILVAAGDLGTDFSEASLAAALAPWPDGPVAARKLSGQGTAPPKGAIVTVDYPSATQAHLLLAQLLPERAAADPLLAHFLVYALRQRLMANLRENKGWSYEVYPFGVEIARSRAIMRFNIPVQNGRLSEAMAEILAEIHRLRDEEISEQYLITIRGLVESQELAGVTSLHRINDRLLEGVRNDQPQGYRGEALRRLHALTPADIQSAARSLLVPERLIWVIAAPRQIVRDELREGNFQHQEFAPAGNAR